jgi:hypothetical protein
MWVCKTCEVAGEINFYKTQKWYCKTCWNKKTAQAGKDKVSHLKSEYGGKCVKCGYDKCVDALEFHHVDPTVKEFHLGEARGRNIKTLKKELEKCILVCRNCHTEIHYKMKTEKGI